MRNIFISIDVAFTCLPALASLGRLTYHAATEYQGRDWPDEIPATDLTSNFGGARSITQQ